MRSAIISRYFPEITPTQALQFEQLYDLYVYWNQQINVISRKDIDHLYIHHVLHALSIAKVITFRHKTKIIDVGTGGGFPGIPLAIFFPEVDFYLIDAVGKKIKVVQEIAKALKLTNVRAQHIRAEEVKEKADFVVGRAIKSMPVFYGWVKHMIHPTSKHTLPNGILYIKGGDFLEEIQTLPVQYNLFPISSYFQEDFFETKQVIHLYQ